MLKSTIAGLAVACFGAFAFATDPNRTVSQYIHDSWGIEKGFPGGLVSAIAQTTDGYLWIGTDKGLVRFDGWNFERYEQASPGSLPIGPVQTLLADAQGNLWILLRNTKLLHYRDGTFNLVRGEAENGITAMSQGSESGVLLSSVAMGPLSYDGKRFLSLLHPLAAPLETADERSARLVWSSGVMPDRLVTPAAAVTSIASTGDGKIWLGAQDGGLFYLSGDGHIHATKQGKLHARVNCLLPLANSKLWVGTSHGVFLWNGTELTSATVPPALARTDALSLIRDRDGNIWVGTARGLLRFNANGVSTFERNSAEATTAVTALFEDREGNMWIGGARGLERLRDSTFVTYAVLGAELQSAGALYVDSDDYTWVAPVEGGLQWMKGEKGGSVTAAGLAHDVVYSIVGNQNELWVGRRRGGLTHLHYDHGSFTAKTYTRSDGLAQNSVYAAYESRDGTLWLGTLSGGVSKLQNGRFTNYTMANGLSSDTVSSIAEGADGTMWFGTPNGLSALTKNGWLSYTVREGLISPDVTCLLQDSADVLWIGTSEGLVFLAGGRVQVPHGSADWLHEAILGLAQDRNGDLWVVTAGHVLGVRRNSLLGDGRNDSDVREFGLADGLRGTEGVKRYQSVVTDSRGRVWVSTNRGLSMVNPARATINSAPALVHIETVAVDGTKLDLRENIQIPPGRQRIAFRFVGLSLSNPERVRYRYRLDGFDRGWSEASTSREATYGNLHAGTYRFRIVASNSDGIWNGSEAAIGFEVEPTLWQTWWFRISGVILILLSVWCAYRYRLHQLTAQFNMRLEERVSERTRIARELHDTLLQSFQGVLLCFHGAMKLLPDLSKEAKERLEGAIDQAEQAILEGRDAVQGLRSSAADSNDLGAALSTFGEGLAANRSNQNAPVFNVEAEGEPQNLQPILRDEVYRIVSEALRNAFRHADAGRIKVGIHYDEQQLRVRVRDDGKGISHRVLANKGEAGHWGLHGMQERAKLVGGKLEVWSKLDEGTEIDLVIPASIAYASSGTRRDGWFSKREKAPKS